MTLAEHGSAVAVEPQHLGQRRDRVGTHARHARKRRPHLGGTSLFGGVGTIAGSALGAILFAELNNGLQVINVNPLYQSIFIGIILIAAVAVDQYRRGRRFRAGP